MFNGLGRRLVSAAVIISGMLLILRLDWWLGLDACLGRPGILLGLLSLVVAVVASDEIAAMFASAAAPVNRRLLMLASGGMVVVTITPLLWRDYPADCPLGRLGFGLSGLVAGCVVMFAGELLRFGGTDSVRGQTIDRLGRSVLALFYLSMLLAFLMAHRYLIDNGYGLMTIVTMITTVKMSDAAAYFVGKSYGTIKLAPALSPGKTLQGSLGGLAGGCLGAGLIVWIVAPLLSVDLAKPWYWVIAYGLLVTLAGMMGDLAESMLKRDSGTKDSSTWLPGLGGVLDVIDSLVFAAPVSFLLWL